LDRKRLVSIIESLLFVAGEPLSARRIAEIVAEAAPAEVREAMEEMSKRAEREDSGLRVVEVAGGYQLQTPPDNSPWIARLMQSKPVRLSRPALETLAIVAYKQPVTRPEIEQVRGVDSGGVLKTLLDHGFVKIAGRKDVPGKPLIYATDKRFMEFFRLKSLADLPTLGELEEIQQERMAEAGQLPLGQEENEPRRDDEERNESRDEQKEPGCPEEEGEDKSS